MDYDDDFEAEESERGSGTPWGWIAAGTVTLAAATYGAYKYGQRSASPTSEGPPRTPAEFLARARAVISSGHARPDMRRLAADLRSRADGTPLGRLELIHRFVRDRVLYHPDPGGRHDYLAPAQETLKSIVGDCDDQAIFLAALLEADGFETALMWVPKHVVACVEVSPRTADELLRSFDHEAVVLTVSEEPDRRWVPLEVTGAGFLPGQLGDYTNSKFRMGDVTLERRPRFGRGVDRSAA